MLLLPLTLSICLIQLVASTCTMGGFPMDSCPDPIYTSWRLTMTQQGLNKYVNFALRDFVPDRFADIIIGDLSGSTNIGIANITWSLTDISLDSWFVDDFGVELHEGAEENVLFFSEAGLSLSFSWEYAQQEWPYVGDSGFGTASVDNLAGDAYIALTTSTTCPGHLNAEIRHMDLDFDLSIVLHGGASWLYDLIIQLLLDVLTDALEDALAGILAPALSDVIDGMTDSYASLQEVGDKSVLDNRFLQAPRFHDLAMMVDMHGQDYGPEDTGRDWVWPETVEMPDILTEDDIQYFIGLPTFNSWLYVHHDIMDSLHATLDHQDVPADYQDLLTAGALSAYAPGLAAYPPEAPLSLRIASTDTPRATVYPAALYMGWVGTVEVGLGEQWGDSDVLFTMSADLGTTGELAWWNRVQLGDYSENFTYCYVTQAPYNSSLSLASSAVGEVDLGGDLATLFGLLAAEAICPWIESLWYANGLGVPETTDFFDLGSLYALNKPPHYVYLGGQVMDVTT